MKTAIILHGKPSEEEFRSPDTASESNKHWIPWLQNQLLINGYHTQTPELPSPFAPNFSLWAEEFERYEVGATSLLIGHSCGGGFLLRWLSENKVLVHKLVLVAPWLDPDGSKCPEFFDFDLDPALAQRTEMHLFASDNDSRDVERSVEHIRSVYRDIHLRLFGGFGHFCFSDMNSPCFPELAEVLLS